MDLTDDQAFDLFDFLARLSEEEVLEIHHESERTVLWDLCCQVERQATEVFDRDYGDKLNAARERLVGQRQVFSVLSVSSVVESSAMPFDFTDAMERLCRDLCARIDELRHIDMDRVAVGYRQTRRRVTHGLQASLTPLRFEGGAETGLVRGRRYQCPRVVDRRGRECLYLLNFYLPRFFDHPLEERLTTVVHELWHIGPAMDGDLRRHEGRCYAHGPSQRGFDEQAARLARRWLAGDPPAGLLPVLEAGFAELVEEHGGVVGSKFATPRMAPLRGGGLRR